MESNIVGHSIPIKDRVIRLLKELRIAKKDEARYRKKYDTDYKMYAFLMEMRSQQHVLEFYNWGRTHYHITYEDLYRELRKSGMYSVNSCTDDIIETTKHMIKSRRKYKKIR